MHGHSAAIDPKALAELAPVQPVSSFRSVQWFFVSIGIVAVVAGITCATREHFWTAYYTSMVYFMGLACGGVAFSAILQIVRAKWSPPLRRIAEANVSYLPYAYMFFLFSYLGKEQLFYWGSHPMPGREWWMQPDFVYGRFAVLLAGMFLFFHYFVRLSLRGDVGFAREHAHGNSFWQAARYDRLVSDWRGTGAEVPSLQRRLSILAPVVMMVYMLIYSLFSFEMIMGMDKYWFSNMFGGFNFVGNIYMALAMLALLSMGLARRDDQYGKLLTPNTLWDLGKLCFGFSMLWGYLFFSQFMVQWYGNLPEETQWMILRTREAPWANLGWVTFCMCFPLPFILLLSRDLKRTPFAFSVVCLVILGGVWLEKYVTIAPQLFPSQIPFGFLEIGFFLGFLGTYLLCVQSFLARYPIAPLSSPLMKGTANW